jgi:hypothetical protein
LDWCFFQDIGVFELNIYWHLQFIGGRAILSCPEQFLQVFLRWSQGLPVLSGPVGGLFILLGDPAAVDAADPL